MQKLSGGSLNEEMLRLQREIAQLDAKRQKPFVTSMSSSASPFGEPEGWPKTERQIALENQLNEQYRQLNQGTVTAEDRRRNKTSRKLRMCSRRSRPAEFRRTLSLRSTR